MSIEDALGFAIPVVFFVLLAAEPWLAGRRFPTVRRWRWIGVAALVVVLILNVSLPLLIPPDALRAIRLVDGERLGIAGGAVVGYLALSGVTALWHRLEHGVRSSGAGSTSSTTRPDGWTSRGPSTSTPSRSWCRSGSLSS